MTRTIEHLTFAAPITAADTVRRTITGTVVPYGVIGNTSVGPVIFEAGAFGLPDLDAVRLQLEHDRTRPLGRAVQLSDSDDAMVGVFRIAATSAGDDALVEAADGLRDGLSVGANIDDYHLDDDGTVVVTAATLAEVSLVTTPAFQTARVATVAASQQEHTMPEPETNPEPTGTAPVDTLTAAQIDARVVDAVAEALASVTAANPPTPPAPRIEVNEPDLTAGQHARAIVMAARGDQASRDFLTAALEQGLTVDNPGVIPRSRLGEFINAVRGNRPTIDRMTPKRLPEAGMKFELPRWVVKPLTGKVAVEADVIASRATQIDNLEVTVVNIAGGNKVSVDLIERSSPAYLDELIGALIEDFRDRTNAYAYGQLRAGMVASDAETLDEAFTQGIADSYAASKKVPNVSLGAIDRWKEVRNYKDSTGRKIYSASNPVNHQGRLIGNAIAGEVEGTSFSLEDDATAGDLLLWPSEATNYYEQPGAPLTVRLQQVSTLEWEVAVYGFLAVAIKHPTAVRNLTVTPPA